MLSSDAEVHGHIPMTLDVSSRASLDLTAEKQATWSKR